MSENVFRLASSRERPAARACNTCLHRPHFMGTMSRCMATNNYLDAERKWDHYACGPAGNLWELRPPPAPVLIRLKRWLVG